MAETNYKFPLVDDQGKLFDRFPLIILHLSSGQKVHLNYFTKFAAGYRPSRYMVEDGFIPTVEYHTRFLSPQWTCKEFLRHAEETIRKESALQISNTEFVLMNNVCKIEILEHGGDIICFGTGEWVNKTFFNTEEPYVCDEHDITIRKHEPAKPVEKFDINKWVDSLEKN